MQTNKSMQFLLSKDVKIILKYFVESCNRKLLSNVLKARLQTFKIICVT